MDKVVVDKDVLEGIEKTLMTESTMRSDNDLDSITVGSSSKKQVKLYYNSRVDKKDDLELRCELAAELTEYLETALKDRVSEKKGMEG